MFSTVALFSEDEENHISPTHVLKIEIISYNKLIYAHILSSIVSLEFYLKIPISVD